MFHHHSIIPWGSFRGGQEEKWGSFQGWGSFRSRDHFGVGIISGAVYISAPQECITDIRNWMIADRLKLNDDKTEFMIIGSRTQLDKVNVSEIVVGQAKVLAVMIVRNLSMSAHKNNTCQALIYHMYNIKCNSKYLRYDDGKSIVQAVIMSLIDVDYCNSLSHKAKYRL